MQCGAVSCSVLQCDAVYDRLMVRVVQHRRVCACIFGCAYAVRQMSLPHEPCILSKEPYFILSKEPYFMTAWWSVWYNIGPPLLLGGRALQGEYRAFWGECRANMTNLSLRSISSSGMLNAAKGVLHSVKRALPSTKRAIYPEIFQTWQVCHCGRWAHQARRMLLKESYILSKEPYALPKEPYMIKIFIPDKFVFAVI